MISEITMINAYSEAFEFLNEESEIYRVSDLMKCYRCVILNSTEDELHR